MNRKKILKMNFLATIQGNLTSTFFYTIIPYYTRDLKLIFEALRAIKACPFQWKVE